MMPIVRSFFLAAVVLSLTHARTISASEEDDKTPLISRSFEGSQHTAADLSLVTLRGVTRSLAGKATVTCNKYPQICRNKDSPGPDCCRKQCVDVMTDGLNCGQCGYKCKYGAACCGGRCVNFSNDEKNCGGCYKRCSEGDICVHGLCNYA